MKYCDVGQRLLERIGACILHGRSERSRRELINTTTHLDDCVVCSDYATELWLHMCLGPREEQE